MGHIDDVPGVSGHHARHPGSRVCTGESPWSVVLMTCKGESIFAFVVLCGERPTDGIDEALTAGLRDRVVKQIDSSAKPDDIRFSDNLPKTRSGKIMHRLLRTIVASKEITLENEAIILQLQDKA